MYVVFKTEQKATYLRSINIKHVLTIYRELQYNEISVIENNTFNNLPNLHNL